MTEQLELTNALLFGLGNKLIPLLNNYYRLPIGDRLFYLTSFLFAISLLSIAFLIGKNKLGPKNQL